MQGEVWVNTGQWLKNLPHDKRSAAEPAALSRDGSLGRQPMVDSIIYSLVSDGNYSTFAGTSDGLMRSDDDGIAWAPVSTPAYR